MIYKGRIFLLCSKFKSAHFKSVSVLLIHSFSFSWLCFTEQFEINVMVGTKRVLVELLKKTRTTGAREKGKARKFQTKLRTQTLGQEGHSHNQGQVEVSRWHWLSMFLKVKRKPASMLNIKRKNSEADGLNWWTCSKHPFSITFCPKIYVKA